MLTELESVSGRRVRAIEVFAHALRFFREHALKVKYKTRIIFFLFHACYHIPYIQSIVTYNYHLFSTCSIRLIVGKKKHANRILNRG